MLWSSAETVAFKLGAAPSTPGNPQPVRFEGEGWLARVEAALAPLSPLERAEVRAAGIAADGSVGVWDAMPAETFLLRHKSAWLPDAINNEAIFPFYQPIVDVRTGKTIGFEALVRAYQGGRLLSGGEIVDAARAHNALFQLDQRMRTLMIGHASTRLHPGELLFLNFLPMVIYDPKICLQTTWEAAQAANWPMETLVFEVVESEAFPDIAHLRRILDAYRERGCQVALDDLGTGHTALSYIDDLRPNIIKLAKGLLAEHDSAAKAPLVRGLVEHAKNRDITVLLEGVETQDQLEAARDLGIDLVQGYLLGKPAAEPVRTEVPLRRAA